MKKIVYRTALAFAAVATMLAVPFSSRGGHDNMSAAANPISGGSVTSDLQTAAQRLGLSAFPDVQFASEQPILIAARSNAQARFEQKEAQARARGAARENAAEYKASLKRLQADGVTVCQIYNPGQPPVTTWFVVPAGSPVGGPTLISQLTVKDGGGANVPITQPFSANPRQGYVTLPTGATYTLSSANNILGGVNITFGDNPPQCPCTSGCTGKVPFVPGPPVPNGTNYAEVTLNVNSGNESCDISCNTGANSVINMTFSGGPNWSNGVGNNNVTTIQNGPVNVAGNTDANCGLQGVYPFNASTCTAGPPSCPGAIICTAPRDWCTIERGRGANGFGGTVQVRYLGPLTP